MFKENLGDLQRTMMAVSKLLVKLDSDFDWERCRSYYSGHDPNCEKWYRLYEKCDSKIEPKGGGLITCKHTKKACQAFNCPVWIMKIAVKPY